MNFFSKYKTAFLLLGLLLISLIIGFLLYTVFFKGVSTPDEPKKGEVEDGSRPGGFPGADEGEAGSGNIVEENTDLSLPESKASQIAAGGLTAVSQLTSGPILEAKLSANGNDLKYYSQSDGKFYQIDKYGELSPLSDKVFHNVDNVTWAQNQNKAVIEYPDGANIVYDFQAEKQITLPINWQDFDFSPQDDKLVLKNISEYDKESNWLAISNSDGTGVVAIESLGDNADSVYSDWSPNNQIIAMYTKGLDFNRQEVFFLGKNDENFRSTIVEGRGFDPMWSPEGDQLLYSVYSTKTDMKPNLWLVDARGESIGTNRTNLRVNTWASKCTYANSSTVYCAVPEELSEGAGVFPELAANTKDNLYEINLKSGAKSLVAVPDGTYNMSNLIINKNNSYLYFTDKTSNTLHQIRLK